MLKINKDKRELKIVNAKAFVALITATTLMLSGCGKKIDRANIDNTNESSQSLLAEEQVTTEAPTYNAVVKTDWETYKKSVRNVIENKFKNSLDGYNLETSLLLLNMDYLKTNNISILDQYFSASDGIDLNDEMNQLYKLLSEVREYNTNITNSKEYISFNDLLYSSKKDENETAVIDYLESCVKNAIDNKDNSKEDTMKKAKFDEIMNFANGKGTICGLYQVDLSNDAMIASENIMQQYSVLVQNVISYEERTELDKILNSHNYLFNVENNISELNGYARPAAKAEKSLEIKEQVLNQIQKGYDDVKNMGVTEEEYNDLFAIANIDYFVKDINNNAVFKNIYGNKIDMDSMFTNAEAAVQKIQAYNVTVTNIEDLYDYGHLYVSSVGDILNTRYVVNLSYDINNSTSKFDSSAAKLKLYNQYSENLAETTYTYENMTYRIDKNSISEGATQINNWISYYTYVINRAKFNNDEYVDNMISLVNGSVDGLNPYDEIVLMVTDFCANKNEGAFQYKIGEIK